MTGHGRGYHLNDRKGEECKCHKRSYSKQGARQEAKRRTKDEGVELTAYKCPFRSDTWHVGHGPKFNVTRDQRRRIVRSKG